jgi:hypothetical protein
MSGIGGRLVPLTAARSASATTRVASLSGILGGLPDFRRSPTPASLLRRNRARNRLMCPGLYPVRRAISTPGTPALMSRTA